MGLLHLAVVNQTGDPLSEVVTLKIHQNNTAKELDFQVVETINKPLLSAETCEKLGLFKLTISDTVQVNSVGPVSVKMSAPLIREKVLTEYKDVFNCLGHIGDSSSFTIDPNYPLVQHVLRYITVTLQKEVKEKIAELERKGIIQKVAESTSWISSMVVLEKFPPTFSP